MTCSGVSTWQSTWRGSSVCLRQHYAHKQLPQRPPARTYASVWNRRYSQPEDDLILERRKQNHSSASIANELGRSKPSVFGRHRHRLQHRSLDAPTVVSKADPELVQQMLLQGKEGTTYRQISKVLGASAAKVKDICWAAKDGYDGSVADGSLTDDEVRTLLSLRAKKQNWEDVANALGGKWSPIRTHCYRLMHRKNVSEFDCEMKDLFEIGHRKPEIAEHMILPLKFVEKRFGAEPHKQHLQPSKQPTEYRRWMATDLRELSSLWSEGPTRTEFATKVDRGFSASSNAIEYHRYILSLEHPPIRQRTP